MPEKWNLSKDKGDSFGALLIDLSKTFGCLSHVFVYGKILALARFTPYMTVSKTRFFMNAFFRSQLSYYPLVWMCHSRTLNNKINRFHEDALESLTTISFQAFKICLIRTNLFHCTLVVMYKRLL